ncbi:Uncharacterised protein [Vibrio furnissii]|nr:Uncharacterised protein [Vibrio furnissii]
MKERVYHEALLVIQALVVPGTRYPEAFCTRDFIHNASFVGCPGALACPMRIGCCAN